MQELLNDLPDDLRRRALTHPAFAAARAESFERLEFLGDSVLGLAITDELYRRFPDLDEGELTRMRAKVVSRDSCAVVARESGLGEAMVEQAAAAGEAHRANAERLASQRNALAALTESVLGAAFLAHGYSAITRRVVAAFEDRIAHALDNRVDARSELQELASRSGADVEWREAGEDGPPHDRTFSAAVTWTGPEAGDATTDGSAQPALAGTLQASGSGRSKQEAQHAAAAALLALMKQGEGEE
ncbi:MAG: ribonuclease III [Thermoleophilia bacterium]|nr:ribonuclease III [Thermoleophilia bacterium]